MFNEKKKEAEMVNITPIVDNHNCTQCGTCIAACPHEAISLYQHSWRGLLPKVDKERCTKCGICLHVCPGEEIDFNGLKKDVYGYADKDEFFGHIIQILSGYSTNRDIRYKGASGGVVTGLLIDLLKNKEIDGALIVNMKGEKPLWPNIFIARTREEIISAQQSKYIPVPMNIGLKEILKNKNERYAILGLPCHFQSLRMFEKIRPQLKKLIVLRIGLMCGFNPTLSSTKFLVRRAGVKDFNDVVDIKYRDGDWPCGFRALTKDGGDHFLYPVLHFLFSHYIFERRRCAMCMDQLNELADISIGDEWRVRLRGDVQGWSYIITRTQIGDEIIKRSVDRGALSVENSSLETLYGGQNSTMIFKKRGTVAFGKIQHMLGKPIPNYLKRQKLHPRDEYFFGAALLYVVPKLFEIRLFRGLFLRVSQRVLNKYRTTIIRLFRK